MSTKPSNPKDSVGVRKAPLSTVPAEVLMEIGVGMLEGARKYGRHNYRVVGVRASVYYDACLRHLMAWWEGEDVDPDSGMSHITKLLTSAVVLRDAMLNEKLTDDRPPRLAEGWVQRLNEAAAAVTDRHPEPKAAYTHAEQAQPAAELSETHQPTEVPAFVRSGRGHEPTRSLDHGLEVLTQS